MGKRGENLLISVIVPIYNVKEYLSRCIESIINQTYKDMEIILIDDGSCDGSEELCEIYKERDKRIVVIHQENAGLVMARKKGLSVANGEFICFVDGDDYIDAQMYESMLPFMEDGIDFVNTGYYSPGVVDAPNCSFYRYQYNQSELIKELLLGVNNINIIRPSIWSKLFRAEVIKAMYARVDDDSAYGEDVICLFNIISEGYGFTSINRSFYHYVTRIGSLTNRKIYQILEDRMKLNEKIRALFANNTKVDICEEDLDSFFLRDIMMILKKGIGNESIQVYKFPHYKKLVGKRIVLWGAGKVGMDYYSQLSRDRSIEIVAWIDKNANQISLEYATVRLPEVVSQLTYDFIIIAMLSKDETNSLMRELDKLEIDREKVLWDYPIVQ